MKNSKKVGENVLEAGIRIGSELTNVATKPKLLKAFVSFDEAIRALRKIRNGFIRVPIKGIDLRIERKRHIFYMPKAEYEGLSKGWLVHRGYLRARMDFDTCLRKIIEGNDNNMRKITEDHYFSINSIKGKLEFKEGETAFNSWNLYSIEDPAKLPVTTQALA